MTTPNDPVLEQLRAAVAAGKLLDSSLKNILPWLAQPRYAPYRDELLQRIAGEQWPELNDLFWTVIPFGTAGRRGRMDRLGSNAINDITIGDSAQGLAVYLRRLYGPAAAIRVAIAYDTRHNSRHFAELCAEILAAAEFTVLFFHDPRATPELAYTVRARQCHAGLVISASHNPPSDNAVKVFWSNGGQIYPPDDARLIREVMAVTETRRMPLAEAVAAGRVVDVQEAMDREYQAAVLQQAVPGPRDLKVLYSPLHGVGLSSVLPVLQADGFDVAVYAPHATPDGDFPNVPQHIANPESPAVFNALIDDARRTGADLVIASDPDADRLGVATPLLLDGPAESRPWSTLTGNQIAVMLADFLLDRLQTQGKLTPQHFIIKTLVTTDMLARVAEHYGVTCFGDVPTGFKWISHRIDQAGADRFVFGCEEAHGYLAGTHIRDKDGAVAAMLLAELAAELKQAGQNLHDRLLQLYRRHGLHWEKTVTLTLPGAAGAQRREEIMHQLRQHPPQSLAGLRVSVVRDYYGHPPGFDAAGSTEPAINLLILDLDDGNWAAIRPSGTEPKLKFYLFAVESPEQSADLAAARMACQERMQRMEHDLLAAAERTAVMEE